MKKLKAETMRAAAALEHMTGAESSVGMPPVDLSYQSVSPSYQSPARPRQYSPFAWGFGVVLGICAAIIFLVVTIIIIIAVSIERKPQAYFGARAPAVPRTIETSSQEKVMDPAVEALDSFGMSALHRAARDGNAEMTKDLIARRADINKRSPNGWTPLHLAARHGNSDVIRLLLAGGADPKIKVGGETALEIATKYGRQEAQKLLALNAK